MKSTKLICWNVNGLRAVQKYQFLEKMQQWDPDCLSLQESKIQEHQVTQELLNPLGYYSSWAFADRAGYSGVVTYSKVKPLRVQKELLGAHHNEGRLILTEFENFTLINIYIPNGGQGDHRIQYKLDYYDELLDFLEDLRKKDPRIVICGDFNTAHNPIDLARPKENEQVTGFLPVERAWIDKFLKAGYVDTFRRLHPDQADAYSWWSYRGGARDRNVGWRIDYFFTTEEFFPHVKKSEILADIYGSDHCPLLLELDV